MRLVQVVHPGGDPEEEVAEDRLADVHRLELRAQLGPVEAEPGADPTADLRLELADQLRSGIGVAGPHAADVLREGFVLDHAIVPRRAGGSRRDGPDPVAARRACRTSALSGGDAPANGLTEA